MSGEGIRCIDRQRIEIYCDGKHEEILFTEPALEQLGCSLQKLISRIQTPKELEDSLIALQSSGGYTIIPHEGCRVFHYKTAERPRQKPADVLDATDRESIEHLCENAEEMEEMPDLHPEEEQMENGCPRRKKRTTSLDLKPILAVRPDIRQLDEIIDLKDKNNKKSNSAEYR